MAILVKSPELPFVGGTVTWWEKEVGQEVLFGDVLVEIRSGSTDYLVKAYLPGTLLHIFAKAGTEVVPDAPLALIGEKSENVQEWLSVVSVPAESQSVTAEPSLNSSFSTQTKTPLTDQSGFTVATPEKQAGFEVEKDTILASTPPSADSGSSFTTHETPIANPFSPTDHLTTEQSQHLQAYGRGFDKFVKMRPVPQQGAMGELFFATQVISGRDVVIKRIKADRRTDAKSREYFMREINLGTALPYHKNIINILYSDENEFGPYYVMERINGHSLQHLIDNQQFPAEKLRDTLVGILEGLRHIHAHWMVHRDLKPMNILVDTQLWTPKIIDFGFAKHPSYPDIDVFDMGTVGYMAPEQHSDQKEVTTKADIYAMGCVLYTMLTRQHPQPIDLNNVTDPAYAAIISKCTQSAPGDRYTSVQEILDLLQKKPTDSGFATKKETAVRETAVTVDHSLENFKNFINEWALEALPVQQPMSKMTLKLLQKQAETAGIDRQKLEPELHDFIELYREIKGSGELTAFKKRSLQVQGSLVYITEATIDRILELSNIPVSAKFSLKTTGTFPVYTAKASIKTPSESPAIPPSIPAFANPVTPVEIPATQEPSSGNSAFGVLTHRLLYARAVGLFEAFEAEKLTPTQQADSLYELQLTTADTASFVIASGSTAQEAALQNKRFYLHPACVLVEVEPVLHQKITTLEPGKLQRSGNFWKITEKAKIRIG